MQVNKKIFNLLLLLTMALSACDNASDCSGIENIFKPAKVDLASIENQLLSIDQTTLSKWESFAADSIDSNWHQLIYSPGNKTSKWFNKLGLNEDALTLIENVENCGIEGLRSKDYQLATIDSLQELLKNEKLDKEGIMHLELLLSKVLLDYSRDMVFGRIKSLDVNKNWQNVNDTIWTIDTLLSKLGEQDMKTMLDDLRPAHPWYKKFKSAAMRLNNLANVTMDLSALNKDMGYGDSADVIPKLRNVLNQIVAEPENVTTNKWDIDLVQAITTYQRSFGLKPNGVLNEETKKSLTEKSDKKLRQLAMNMERMRWLTKDFKKEFIWVNIPQMEVDYYEEDSVSFNMRVVVGRLSRKTPTLDSKLSNIVFNPPWYVPPTILKQEVLPGIKRRGGAYLARRGLVARDRRGRKINPSKINANNYRRYSISQNPGRYSALGSVKFNFPNKEAIFLHDTNHRGDFGKKYRAFSSGCIRVHHPKDFARFILRDSTYNENGIDSIIKRRQTKSVKVKRDVGVHIVYLTNAVDSVGNVVMVKDLYKWDKTLAPYF